MYPVVTPAKSAYHRLLAFRIRFLMNCGVFNYWHGLRWVVWTRKLCRKFVLRRKLLVWILHVIPLACLLPVRDNNIFTFWVAIVCCSWKQISSPLLCSLYPRMSAAHVRHNSKITSRELVCVTYTQKCRTGDRHREFLPHPDVSLSCWVMTQQGAWLFPLSWTELLSKVAVVGMLSEGREERRNWNNTKHIQASSERLTNIYVLYVKILITFIISIVAPCILKSTQFTHQQMHYLLTWLKVLNLH